MGDKAYQRHIRRTIHAPVHRFAAITPHELAPLCQGELHALGFTDTTISEAGVEFSGKISACYLANLWLRTASRVLCRLPVFRAGTAEELFHKVSTIPWELWLNPGIPLQVDAYVYHSRIQHEGLVSKTVSDGIQRRFAHGNFPVPIRWEGTSNEPEAPETITSSRQRILVHLRKNHCEISLDSTGANLHQRGYRLHHTGAPIRENLAAAILSRVEWRGDRPLVDGMCGAGTMPIEAALVARHLPPGLMRSFLFEKWPAFQEKTWNYLRKKAKDEALPLAPVPIHAVDHSPEAVATARQNAVRAGADHDIQWHCTDFFSFKPSDHRLPPGLLFLNPPYGRRLAGGDPALFRRLGSHLRSAFEGWQAIILVPMRKQVSQLKLGPVRIWRIEHGGSPVWVAVARL